MSWYAQVVFDKVTLIIYVVDGKDNDWCHMEYGGTWLGVAENGSIRGNFPSIGFTYDVINDVFYPSQPYPSWTISAPTWTWKAPVPYPTDGKVYTWDEATTSWIGVIR